MAREGLPFVIVPAIIALIFGYFEFWIAAALMALLAAFMAYFFRDPQRQVPEGDDIVVSAADGRVTRVDDTERGKLVSVFLSPLDVHINRSPIAGAISKVEHIFGKKLPATSGSASDVNERKDRKSTRLNSSH